MVLLHMHSSAYSTPTQPATQRSTCFAKSPTPNAHASAYACRARTCQPQHFILGRFVNGIILTTLLRARCLQLGKRPKTGVTDYNMPRLRYPAARAPRMQGARRLPAAGPHAASMPTDGRRGITRHGTPHGAGGSALKQQAGVGGTRCASSRWAGDAQGGLGAVVPCTILGHVGAAGRGPGCGQVHARRAAAGSSTSEARVAGPNGGRAAKVVGGAGRKLRAALQAAGPFKPWAMGTLSLEALCRSR